MSGVSAGVPPFLLVGWAISPWLLACLASADRVRVPARAAHVSELALFSIFAVPCEPIEFSAYLCFQVLLLRGAVHCTPGPFPGSCWACLECVVNVLAVGTPVLHANDLTHKEMLGSTLAHDCPDVPAISCRKL